MKNYSDERRCGERVPTKGIGAICRFGNHLCPAPIRDLSVSGMRLGSCQGLHMGAETNVTIFTHNRGSIRARGEVVHLDPDYQQMGIVFYEMDPASRAKLDDLVADLQVGQRFVSSRV